MQDIEKLLSQAPLKRPLTYLLTCLAIMAVCIAGLKHISFDADPSIYFSDDHEHYNAFKKIESVYGHGDSLVFVIKATEGSLYTRENLAIIEDITKKSWTLPYATRVDSLANYNYSYSEDDDLIVEPLIEDAMHMSDAQIAFVEHVAMTDPDVKGRLASDKAPMALIRVRASLPKLNRQQEEKDMAAAAKAITAKYEALEHIDILYSGNVISNNEVTDIASNDVMTVIPLMYLVIFVMLGFLLRSFSAVFSIFIVTNLSCMAALGLASWMGLVLNMMSITSVNIIITISIAHCVHILVFFLQQYHQGIDKATALRESLRINLTPITLTSLTTALGFISMNLSKMPPAHDLGNIVAIGVVVAFGLSIFFLPPLLLLLPIKRRPNSQGGLIDRWMNYLGAAVVKKHKPLLIISIVFSAGMLYLAPQNIMNDKFTENVKMPNQFRSDNKQIDDYFGGLYTVEYIVNAKDEGGIAEPEYLAALEKFTIWLRAQPEVRNVQSYTDLIKRLNRNMHGDDTAYYQLPATREEAAQYQLLYEMSQPFGSDMTSTIRQDKGATRLIASLPSTDTTDMIALQQRAQQWQRDNMPEYMYYSGESLAVMWGYLGQEAIVDGLKGALLALFLISLILAIVFKSIKYGLISLIPNLLPAGVGYGIWAIIDGQLSMGQMMVLSITIGIVVDDTVHFLSKYLRGRRELNNNAAGAVRYAFRKVGPALWITTAVLVLGFGMLLNSGFIPNSDLGLLTMFILISAISLDFFLLPPLLMLLDKDKQSPKLT